MQKVTFLLSFGLSVVATVLLTFGFSAAAAKIDPVAYKAKSISTSDFGCIASLPCMGGGGGDPVERTLNVNKLV